MSISYFKDIRILNIAFSLSCRRLFARKLHEINYSFSAEKLINRKVLRISGNDSCEFLQGLITNDMNILLNGSSSIYTMFLNSKGRVLYDAFIYKTKRSNCFYVDCDNVCVEELVKHLKMYRVRRKIDISTLDSEYSVWAIYDSKIIDHLRISGRKEDVAAGTLTSLINETQVENIIACDPRLSSLGYRALITSDDVLREIPLDNRYMSCRHKLGVGEGVNEFQIGQSFPLEINCDFLNGVSFDKGCYIGQELTARTFHTGVIRKRLMPLEFEKEPKDIPYDTVFDYSGVKRKSPLGKFKGSSGCFGLGLMRVSEALECKSFKLLDIKTKVMAPYWWPNIPAQRIDMNANL